MVKAERSAIRERVGFTNYVMFREVLRDDLELCRALIERILGLPIERVEEKQVEHVVDPRLRSRGARFDLYVKGADRVIDVEMQSARSPVLGRRMRYYQGALDASLLPRGVQYRNLPESYIVFVCEDDPFARGIPRYTIEPICREDPSLSLKADMHWLVLNASAFELEEERGLRNLLCYVKEGTVDESDPLVRGIDAKVDGLNESDEVMEMIWTVQDEIDLQADLAFEDGEAKGRSEGRSEGRFEGETRLSKLMKLLFDAGRIEDAERAASDEAYRAGLFKEFGIA